MADAYLKGLYELRDKFINDPEMKAHYEGCINQHLNEPDDTELPQD